MEWINASGFKARRLAILDSVHDTGEPVVILKRRRHVAQLSRVTTDGEQFPQAELKGAVVILGVVAGPALSEEHWESLGPQICCSTLPQHRKYQPLNILIVCYFLLSAFFAGISDAG